MIHCFYWLVEGVLAGCSRPGATAVRPDDVTPEELDRDLSWLRSQGVDALLSLTETALPPDAPARHGIPYLHLPVPDLHAPHPEDFMQALAFLDRQRLEGRSVAVHCRMGQGRTATVLAACLIRGGREPGDAVAQLRALCPGAIGSAAQEDALAAFARRRDWVL
jgi:atypical dual specificity phosphatase